MNRETLSNHHRRVGEKLRVPRKNKVDAVTSSSWVFVVVGQCLDSVMVLPSSHIICPPRGPFCEEFKCSVFAWVLSGCSGLLSHGISGVGLGYLVVLKCSYV